MNRIFTGRITSWNDSAISATNPDMRYLGIGGVDGAFLNAGGGAHSIIRIVRKEESGTTETFARALAYFQASSQEQAEIDSHPLRGSSLPDWPTADAPPEGVTCMLVNCSAAWCGTGTFLDRETSKCAPCPLGFYNPQERHRMSACEPCQAHRCLPFLPADRYAPKSDSP